jgi:SAM-dependent methyltransferase
MRRLFRGLRIVRQDSASQSWRDQARLCLDHPVRDLVHQDPITLRSYLKPRGYPGDAGLLDLIYDVPTAEGRGSDWTELGLRVHQYTLNESAAVAVRSRRRLLASLIDIVAATRTKPRVLSVAAGHLREADLSRALRSGGVCELIAMDQDSRSLDEVERSYGHLGVRTLAASTRTLITHRHDLGTFDLVYAAGLYDYLSDATAARLTGELFALLRPGGRLLVANFLPETPAAGYMEAFMDWWLTYRSMAEIASLAAGIGPERSVAAQRLFVGDHRNVGFMMLKSPDS